MARSRRGDSRNINIVLGTTGKYVTLFLLLAFVMFPVVWLFATSLKLEKDFFTSPPVFIFIPTLINFERIFTSGFSLYLRNSVIVAATTTFLTVSIGCLAAYALARFKLRGAVVILLMILITRLVPGVTMVVPFFVLWQSLGLNDTLTGLILANTGFSLPLTTWLMYGFFLEIPPELDECAMADGCSQFGAFWRISFPLCLPGIGATAILTFIWVWNEFIFALVLTTRNAKTMPVHIASFIAERASYWGQMFAIGAIIVIPVFILVLFVQRTLIRGLTAGAVKG